MYHNITILQVIMVVTFFSSDNRFFASISLKFFVMFYFLNFFFKYFFLISESLKSLCIAFLF